MCRNNDQLGLKWIDGAVQPSATADGIRGKPYTKVFCQHNEQHHDDEHARGIQQQGSKKAQTLTTRCGHDSENMIVGEAALYKLSLMVEFKQKALVSWVEAANPRC